MEMEVLEAMDAVSVAAHEIQIRMMLYCLAY